ncbi:hypothetical protein CCMA1212_006751 [Trichoderma ghanense]|uniref:Uncharacterized protein n=1 Tax=Trichoderma ghanense TaxID=65468 RepID=A0ABY2GZC2_9HYPO
MPLRNHGCAVQTQKLAGNEFAVQPSGVLTPIEGLIVGETLTNPETQFHSGVAPPQASIPWPFGETKHLTTPRFPLHLTKVLYQVDQVSKTSDNEPISKPGWTVCEEQMRAMDGTGLPILTASCNLCRVRLRMHAPPLCCYSGSETCITDSSAAPASCSRSQSHEIGILMGCGRPSVELVALVLAAWKHTAIAHHSNLGTMRSP